MISIKRPQLTLAIFFVPLLSTCVIARTHQFVEKETRLPSMVVFLSDDHTWRDSSIYGSKDIKTPNMKRLANAGITFNNAFVASPSCAPSRAALLTGMYPACNGAEPNHSKPHPDIKKLPAYLQELGYEVAAFGKVAHYRHTPDYRFDVARHFTYHDDLAVSEAVKWLRSRNSKKPLCLLVGTHWPHVPWPEESPRIDPSTISIPPNHVDTPTTRKWRARYIAAIQIMDRELGEVYDAAREILGNDVFFIHTSDHGAQWPFGKWNLYDDGIRTPMIVSWPGRIARGQRTNAMVSWIDILPTLLDVAGVQSPENIDGKSFLPVLKGDSENHREIIFTTHSGDGNFNVFPIRAAQTSDGWKYIRNLHPEFRFTSHVTKVKKKNGYWQSWLSAGATDTKAKNVILRYQQRPAEELYHSPSDPYERVNLIDDPRHQSRVDMLRGRLDQWLKETGDKQVVYGQPQLANAVPGTESTDDASLEPGFFVNPIGEGADPWVIQDRKNRRYLWCLSEGNAAISIHTSESPNSLGKKHIVWQAPDVGPVSKEIWAPELHFLDGRWHIYFAASDGSNRNHRTYVLRSQSDNPLGQYELHGPLATGDGANGLSPNQWAIDMTVFAHGGKRYAIWSGWDSPDSDHQFLYIAPMKSPTALAATRTKICRNDDFLWERIQPEKSKRGLHEAPQIFSAHGRIFLFYSCGASWLPTYKMGLLELVGDNPLSPSAWKKNKRPIFSGTPSTFGVGHSCFVRSLDDLQWWHVFHAKLDQNPGWQRAIYAQPFQIDKNGFPLLGQPSKKGDVLAKPSGPMSKPSSFSFNSYEYFGHHQFVESDGLRIRLGRLPHNPINAFRAGEKVIFKGSVPDNVKAEVKIDFHGDSNARDAGILFRTTGASVGYDAQRGYFAGLIPKTQLVILGRTDGMKWHELARAKTSIDAHQLQKLTIQIHQSQITVWHKGERKIRFSDGHYEYGSLGLRVVNSDATFSDFKIVSEQNE